MRIEVDRERCDRFGFCEQAAPDLIRINDGEPESVSDAVPDLAGMAGAAARTCPVLRIVA